MYQLHMYDMIYIYMIYIYIYLTTKKLGTINLREREIKGDVWEGLEGGKAMWKKM